MAEEARIEEGREMAGGSVEGRVAMEKLSGMWADQQFPATRRAIKALFRSKYEQDRSNSITQFDVHVICL